MPSSRRLKATGLLAFLTVCIIFYVTNGASSTHNSPFYTRTVAAIKDRQAEEARKDMLVEEARRLGRVERLEKEHNIAMSAAKAEETKPVGAAAGQAHDRIQSPMQPDTVSESSENGGKPVAGRKIMGDAKVVIDKSGKASDDDGVARVGNVGPKSSHVAVGESEEEKHAQRVEVELNDILKKGPIIIFSKSYCPFSKKAKHILLDLYSITPPPYVVELDQHELGPGLQSALQRTTGRRTVPNILVNGRSIGGGDDIQQLHDDDTLVSTVSSLGGKRVMKIEPADEGRKAEVKFKA